MIIYNPHKTELIKKRIKIIENILKDIPTKYCFISGSFLFKENAKDIDVFVISRTKKKFNLQNKKIKLSFIDFNKLYSLLYHSISKSCVSNEFLPLKDLKVTIADYWNVINEAIPAVMNNNNFYKDIRSLILYTEYFRTGEILDSYQLNQKCKSFENKEQLIKYIEENVPLIIKNKIKRSYLRRFFYTQAAVYKESKEYSSQEFLYKLVHKITEN